MLLSTSLQSVTPSVQSAREQIGVNVKLHCFELLLFFSNQPSTSCIAFGVTSVQQHPHNRFLLSKVFTFCGHRWMKHLQPLLLSNFLQLKIIGTVKAFEFYYYFTNLRMEDFAIILNVQRLTRRSHPSAR